MRKLRSLLAVLLAALIVLVMVPFFSVKVNASVEEPTEDLYYSESVTLDTVIDCNCPKKLDFSDKKPKVVMFGDLYGCWNSKDTFSNIQLIKAFYAKSNIDVFFFQLKDYDIDLLKSSLDANFKFGTGDYYIYDGTAAAYSSNYRGLYNWLYDAGYTVGVVNGYSLSMPLVGFFDSNGKLVRVSTSYMYFDDVYEALSAIGLNLSDEVSLKDSTIPDKNFRKYLSENIDSNSDGYLSREEIDKSAGFSCVNRGITDLTGIELFGSLSSLDCSNNNISNLNLHFNGGLIHLDCSNNRINSLNLSSCTSLNYLTCYSNQLTELDLSGNYYLQTISCWKNRIGSLDLGGKSYLRVLYCSDNCIKNLNLSGCGKLTDLDCRNNQISSLNLSDSSELDILKCDNNQITALTINNSSDLTELYCSNNKLTALDVSSYKSLKNLDCFGNSFNNLEIGNNSGLLQCCKSGPAEEKLNYLYMVGCTDDGIFTLCIDADVVVKQNGKIVYSGNSGWRKDSKGWYYVIGSHYISSDWLWKGDWYYFNASGYMVTGWNKIGSKWYFFNSDGKMKTGWVSAGGKWYYLESSGEMVTGWKLIDGVWYNFNSDGQMNTGWLFSGNSWYYLKSDGSMASSEYIKGYWLDADGRWTYQAVASWKLDSKGWYYIDTNGWYPRNASYKIDGKVYNFDKSGYCTNP